MSDADQQTGVHTQNVRLAVMDSAKSVEGQLTVREFPTIERVRRAVVRFCVLLLLGCLFAPIPPIHWVLTPSFLIAAPIFGFLAYRKRAEVLDKKMACPKCQRETEVTRGTTGWPASIFCTLCHNTFRATPF